MATTTPTISESLFADLCLARRIPCERIPTGERKTPDYEISLGVAPVLVEVKQLDPNEDDMRLTSAFDEGRITDGSVPPTQRLRQHIADGYIQLKAHAGQGQACLLVLYNNSGFHNYIDAFSITTAMFGGYGVGLGLNDGRVDVTRYGFMGNSRVTREHRKQLSAVGVLKDAQSNGGLRLVVYHNPFALMPIDSTAMALLSTEQFRHPDPHSSSTVPWEPLKVA